MNKLFTLSFLLLLISCNSTAKSVQELDLAHIFQEISSNLKKDFLLKDYKAKKQNWGIQYNVSAGKENLIQLPGGKTLKLYPLQLTGEHKSSGEKNLSLYVEYTDKIAVGAHLLALFIKTAHPESKTDWQSVIKGLIEQSKTTKSGKLPKEFESISMSGTYSSDGKAVTIKIK